MSDERLLAEAAEGVLNELDRTPKEPWRALQENGWIGVAVAPNAGGRGGTLVEAAVLAEAAGKTCAAAPVVEAIGSALLAGAAEAGGACLERVVSGRAPATVISRILSLTGSSGGARSVAAGPWPAPWARYADALLAIARAEDDDGLYLAYLDVPALELTEGVNMAGEPRDSVRVVAPVPDDCVFRLAASEDDVLAMLAVLHSARQIGAVERVHALAVDYAKERHQFGRPIGSFQVVAHALVKQTELVELARSALSAAVLLEGTPQFVDAALASRVTANSAAGECARIAHQVLGAIGVTGEHSLHRLTLRLAAWRQEFLPPAFWERRLGERVAQAGVGWWEHVGDGMDRIPRASREAVAP